MHRIRPRSVAVAALAFVVGIGCVWFSGIYPLLESKFTKVVVGIFNIERFQVAGYSEGDRYIGVEYVMLLGERLRSSSRVYPSRLLVRQALEERLADASRIIERKPVLVDGEAVGERVEALCRSGAAILRTKGETLYLIEAPSLSLAIALEKSKGED